MALTDFPEATKVHPLYLINGELHKLLPHEIGQQDPNAVRASLPITKGEDKGGKRIGWFRRVTRPLLSEGELASVERIREAVSGEGEPIENVPSFKLLLCLIDAMQERATTVID
jgi:hypothetical protein